MAKKVCYSLVLIIVIISMLFWSIPLSLFAPKKDIGNIKPSKDDLFQSMTKNKKILMVVSFRNFQDEEYFIPKEILENLGFKIETASLQKGIALGIAGNAVDIDLAIEEVKIKEYEAIVFCGGSGMAEQLDNKTLQSLVLNFNKENKLIAAICVAPALLAKAGILQDKDATVWSSDFNQDYINLLQESGAIYKDQSVVVSEKIITANGPDAAEEFGQTIAQVLNNQ